MSHVEGNVKQEAYNKVRQMLWETNSAEKEQRAHAVVEKIWKIFLLYKDWKRAIKVPLVLEQERDCHLVNPYSYDENDALTSADVTI